VLACIFVRQPIEDRPIQRLHEAAPHLAETATPHRRHRRRSRGKKVRGAFDQLRNRFNAVSLVAVDGDLGADCPMRSFRALIADGEGPCYRPVSFSAAGIRRP
jgi:hypothetical protein